MLNIVLFGPPGAGKGTQSQKLIEKYNLVHLSTGDILRGEIAAGSALGLEAKKLMDAGVLVPDSVVIGMISTKLDQNPNAKGFIFDGFPRTAAQAEALDNLLSEKNTKISAMIALEVSDEELTKRLLLRGKDSGRADDQNEGIIRNRINEYNTKTAPLKDYYPKQGKFESINGIGTVEEIFGSLSAVMDEKKNKAEETMTAKVVNLVKAVADRVMSSSENVEEKAPAKKSAPKKAAKKTAKKEEPSLLQRAVAAVKNAVTRTEKAPAKKAAKKSAPKKAAKKVVKKAAATVKKAAKKAAPKKAVKTVKKAAKKIVKKAAPKKAVKAIKKPAAKKVVKKAIKKVAPKKAAKKVMKKVAKNVAKKAAPKKAIKAVKKAAKKITPKKAVKALKKAPKKIAPKKVVKKAVKKVAKKSSKRK